MNQILVGEVLFASLIGAFGASALRIGLVRLGLALTVQFSGIVGILVITVTTVLSLSLGKPNSFFTVSVVGFALLVAFFLIEKRRSDLRNGVFTVVVAALVNAGVTVAIGFLVAPVLTFDSWRFLEHGSSAFGDGVAVQSLLQDVLGSYPIVLISVQGLGASIGMPFVSSSLATVSVLAVSGAFDMSARPIRGRKRGFRVMAIVALVVGVAASAYMTRVQLGLVNSHALVAGYYALGVAAIFAPGGRLSSSRVSAERIRAALLGVACAGIALARVEGLAVVGILLAVAVAYRGWRRSSLIVLTSIGFVVPGIWYVRLVVAGSSTGILSPSRIVVLLAVAAAPLLIAAAIKPSLPVPWLSAAVIVFLSAATLLIVWDSSSELATTVSAFGINLATKGLWGAIWWVVFPLALLALAQLDDHQARGAWLVVTFGFVLVVLLLGGVRDTPYRIGWADSGNRMMVHVLPAFFLLILHAFRRDDQSDSSASPRRRSTRHGIPTATE